MSNKKGNKKKKKESEIGENEASKEIVRIEANHTIDSQYTGKASTNVYVGEVPYY